MAHISEEWDPFETLESRLITILPEKYQDCYENIEPVSMGSAQLMYGTDGKVLWSEMWGSFCDLAMAGGPPHKGKLLRPGSRAEIDSQSLRYGDVVREICRGITMVTGLESEASSTPGWVSVKCTGDTMAVWLTRAILMENVSARCNDTLLDLPAGPAYRLEKEIKNVITVIAKTCHYWMDHVPRLQQRDIGLLFARMDAESPLIQPAFSNNRDVDGCKVLSATIAHGIHRATGLSASNQEYVDWVAVECPDVRTAIWMMRAVVVSNVVSRREGSMVFLPVNPATDPQGETVLRTVRQVYDFAVAQGILRCP